MMRGTHNGLTFCKLEIDGGVLVLFSPSHMGRRLAVMANRARGECRGCGRS